MRIYLDNNATTAVHPEVLDAFERALRSTYGNASSIHEEGRRARQSLEEAREALAQLIAATPREVVFTSGGSESNNAALLGVAERDGKRCHIVTGAIEHPSVLEVMRELERRGHEVTFVSPDSSGRVPAEKMIAALREETRLVALMLANNETGVMQPVAEVARAARPRGIHVHCDAVQAAGREPIDVNALAIDTLALSGHKMHAPKGIGVLYVRSGLTLQPFVRGGAQERRRRAGTENVALAVAYAAAASLPDASEGLRRERDYFEQRIAQLFPFARVNGAGAERIANTSNVCFSGCDGEGIVIALDLAGVSVSSGSACASGRVEPSHVLIAMGLSLEDARSSIRFSLSRFTTREEIDRALAVLGEVVPKHRRAAANGPAHLQGLV